MTTASGLSTLDSQGEPQVHARRWVIEVAAHQSGRLAHPVSQRVPVDAQRSSRRLVLPVVREPGAQTLAQLDV